MSLNSSKSNKKSIDDDEDSSVISDISDNDDVPDAFSYDKKKEDKKKSKNKKDIEESDEAYLKNVLQDRIKKFITMDEMIKNVDREYREKVKPMKESKQNLEEVIIEYLEKKGKDVINLGKKEKLTKVVSESKSAIKLENISDGLREGFEERKLIKDKNKDELNAIIADFLERIDNKREIKIKKSIKRSVDKPKDKTKKDKKNKTNKKDDIKSNISSKSKKSKLSNKEQ